MEVVGPVRVVHQYVNMPEQSAEFYNETTGQIEEVNNGYHPQYCCLNENYYRYNGGIYSGFLTGSRLQACDGLQLRSWHHRRARFVLLQAGNNNVKSFLECRTKLSGRPDERRYSLPGRETYFPSHRTGKLLFFSQSVFLIVIPNSSSVYN